MQYQYIIVKNKVIKTDKSHDLEFHFVDPQVN